jgi:PAS domain S-box-containing protein
MGTRVFVVEDEKIVALDIQARLESLGYEVIGTASNSEAALTQIGELVPDVVLLDMSLQAAMDGVEVAAKVREQLRVPIVFITAYSDPGLIQRIQLTEPFAYILKPFETIELHAALQIATLRSKLERQLIEQKHLLSVTLDSIEDGVIVTGEDGMIRFMNPAAERLTGWAGAEASCHPLHDVYILADDGTLTARDSSKRRVESRSHLMKDDLGNWLGFVHTFVDVTEREASRKVLRERDVEYRILMEQAADAIGLIDDNGRLLAVNSKVCELAGYTREELLIMSLHELMDPSELARDPVQYTALRAGRSVTKERHLKRKDGTFIDVEIHATMLSDGRFQGILRDISERKQTEAKFKDAVRSEVVDKLLQKLRVFAHGESAAMNLNRLSLFTDNPDAFAVHSPDRGNDAPAERFRIAGEEFLGVIAPELSIVSSLAAIIEADGVFGNAAQRLIGVSTQLSDAVRTVRADLPHILAMVAAGPGVAGTANFLTLLRNVGGAVEVIRTALRDIAQCLQSELTCDVDEVLTIALNRFASSAIPLESVCESDMKGVRVVMKAADLSDVLSTLIQNAIESLSSSTLESEHRVTVNVRQPNGKIRIEVEDNGPGVPVELRDRIFEDLFSTKGDGRGFGLGHALRCLQGCGGTLRLDPTVQHGARFVMELVRV